jgi:hypothetical protein
VVDVPLLVSTLVAKYGLTREEARAMIPFKKESAPRSRISDAASVMAESTAPADISTLGAVAADDDEPRNLAGTSLALGPSRKN